MSSGAYTHGFLMSSIGLPSHVIFALLSQVQRHNSFLNYGFSLDYTSPAGDGSCPAGYVKQQGKDAIKPENICGEYYEHYHYFYNFNYLLN